MHRPAAIALSVLLSLSAGTVSAQRYVPIQERMSADEFRDAGLERLSEAELARLNAWLARGAESPAPGAPAATAAAAAVPAVAAEPEFGRRAESRAGDGVSSRVAGNFRGWQGRGDVIELENGQRWRINDNSRLRINVDSPTVTVRSGALGAYYLQVEGYNTRARVIRVD